MMTPAQREWIDNASYEDLLRKWRFAIAGDPIFQGGCHAYFLAALDEKKEQEGEEGYARASKAVGWDA